MPPRCRPLAPPRLFVCLYSAAESALAHNLLASLDRCGCGGENVRAYCTDASSVRSTTDRRHQFLDVAGILARVPPAMHSRATALLRFLVILTELRAGNDVWFLDVGAVARVNLDTLLWRPLQAAQLRHAAPLAVFGDYTSAPMLFSTQAEPTLAAFLASAAAPESCCCLDNDDGVAVFFEQNTPMHLPAPQRLDARLFPLGPLFFGPRGRRRSDRVRAEAWLVRTDHLHTVEAKTRALRASGQWLCYRAGSARSAAAAAALT